MTDLLTRVREALGSEWPTDRSPWDGLIRLYKADREAFYLLALAGEQADPEVERLGQLAHQVRNAVRSSYRLKPPSSGGGQVETTNDRIPVPADLFPRVQRFLLEIDGKGVSENKGRDYEGQAISEAEGRFKLGDRESWEATHARVEVRRKAIPVVLRLDPEDLTHLGCQPAYVTHELLHCARQTVLAPTVVYRGLKRGGDAPATVNNGWAFFGKPRRAYRNDGSAADAPPGMVFVVFADQNGFVFDWDWVEEDPDKPGYPLGPCEERFNEVVDPVPEAILDLPSDLRPGEFDATEACYSNRGDCIFCYITDEESYAVRINADLTVFQRFGTSQHTGFKIKNVRRILEVDQTIVVSDPPALTVSVDSMLLATLKRHPDVSVQVYSVLIRAMYHGGQSPPKVKVRPEELVTA